MQVSEPGFRIGALADKALGLDRGEGAEDLLDLLAEGLVERGAVERASSIGHPPDRGQLIAMQVAAGAADAFDVLGQIGRPGARRIALEMPPR